ncbi:MAG: SDR family oxidoreductase [Spirochaetales bacterium]|nr:SDR family oxidoreductase [Spirochaetales bacterium]
MSFVEDIFGLKDKVIIITGGGGVIAGAFSVAFLKAGARIALLDRKQENIDRQKDNIRSETPLIDNVFGVVADAADEASVERAIQETEKAFGKPNVLINAAGGNRGKTKYIETDIQAFESILKLNLIAGLVVPTKVVAKYWIEHGIKGAIINMTSMASYNPLTGVWAYDAAKAGVLNLTMATANELAAHGIRVNAIAPGFFIGKQNKALLIQNEETGELTERGKNIISRTPFRRFGDVSELAGAAVYLCSDRASGFVTGVSLAVDGGYLIDNV